MTNEPILKIHKKMLTLNITKDYNKYMLNWTRKNKPISNPIKANFWSLVFRYSYLVLPPGVASPRTKKIIVFNRLNGRFQYNSKDLFKNP
jgi:hypothetical protein